MGQKSLCNHVDEDVVEESTPMAVKPMVDLVAGSTTPKGLTQPLAMLAIDAASRETSGGNVWSI